MIHSLWVPTKMLLTRAWPKIIRWHILLILFQHFVILSTFSLKPSSESPARASHKSSSQGPWSACSRSCGGGVQWRAQLNGTRYLQLDYFTFLPGHFINSSLISGSGGCVCLQPVQECQASGLALHRCHQAGLTDCVPSTSRVTNMASGSASSGNIRCGL